MNNLYKACAWGILAGSALVALLTDNRLEQTTITCAACLAAILEPKD